VIPELDSHHVSSSHPHPLSERFSPWHAAGPPSSYSKYSAAMRRHGDLHLLSAVLRLAPGDHDTNGAAKQWKHLFGVHRGLTQEELAFTNAKIIFVPGQKSKHEGIVTITIGVNGKERLDNIFQRATDQRLRIDDEGSVEMLGILWRFVPLIAKEGRTVSRL
jgi:hypothetical protein